VIVQIPLPPNTGEPILINAIAIGAGALIVWGAITLVQVRDAVQSLKTAVFGDLSATKPEGIKNDLTELKRALEAHLSEEDGQLRPVLARIARKLGIEGPHS